MTQFILDLFFTAIFVLLLVLLIKIREKAFHDNKDSYRYAFWGMLVLGIVSILQLASHQNFLETLPFISEPVYQELAQITGIIAGVTLLIAGITIWLPGKKKRDEIDSVLRGRENLIGRASDIIRDSGSIDILFNDLTEGLRRDFHFESAAVFRLSHRTRTFICSDKFNVDEKTGEFLARVSGIIENETDLVQAIRQELVSLHRITAAINNKGRVFLFFWGGKEQDRGNISEALVRIGRLLSERLTYFYKSERLAFAESSLHLLTEARNILSRKTDLRRALPEYYQLFHESTGAEYFSLAVQEKQRRNLRHYTAGINGSILLGGVTSPGLYENYMEATMTSGQGLIAGDVRVEPNKADYSLFSSCGQRCLLAVPVMVGGHAVAVITLGHPGPGRFGRRELGTGRISGDGTGSGGGSRNRP